MSDCYVVVDGARVVGVSARLQGAELLRSEEAGRYADHVAAQALGGNATAAEVTAHLSRLGQLRQSRGWNAEYRVRYDGMRIENHELRDVE